MLPLERYQLDCLLEEKAQQLESIVGPVVERRSDAGSYETDDGREMGINTGHPDSDSLSCLLMVNKRGRILVFSYSFEPYTSFENDEEDLTEEEVEKWEEENRRWEQQRNPDQLRLPLVPVQRSFRFPQPLEIVEAAEQDAHFWTYRFELMVRYLPENDHWDILWKGNPQFMTEIRKLLPPLPSSQSGHTVEESVALKLVQDLLEIIERKDR